MLGKRTIFGNKINFGKRIGAIALVAMILTSTLTLGVGFVATAAPACEDIAISGISASGHEAVNPPSNAIDDSLRTRWSNQGWGSWIEADLGDRMVVCSVDIAWYKGNTRSNIFVISLSENGRSYTDVYSGSSSGRSAAPETYSFSETTARYVKITVTSITNGNNGWVSITEIGASGYTPVNDDAPSVRIMDPIDGTTFVTTDSRIAVRGTASDDNQVSIVEVRVNGGTYVTATPRSAGDWSEWSATVDLGSSGEHRIVSRATDNAGNQAWNSIHITATVDATPPSLEIISPADGAAVPLGTLVVQGSASDGESGVNKVEVRVNGGTYVTATPRSAGDWSEWSATVDISAGNYEIRAKAADKAGNSKERLISLSGVGDNASPIIAITTPVAGSTASVGDGYVLVSGTATDGESGISTVEVRVDSGGYVAATPRSSGDWSEWSVRLPITVGEHRLVPRATDNAGNQAWNSIYVTFLEAADTASPSVLIISPSDSSTTSGNVINIQGKASDSGSGVGTVEVRIDDGSYSIATPRASGDWSTWSISLPISAGEHRIVSRATDNAGNQAWNSIYVTVNGTPLGGGDGGMLDQFGIEKIYPTASGGNEWYVNMDDPRSDPLFRNLPSMTKQSDGSWQVNGGSRGQVRMEAWSPPNEKWLNVEITGYAKMVSGSNELIQWYSRGGHHTSSDECLGSAYKARLYGDGEARWVKEVTHPAYTSNRGSVQATNTPLDDRWVGFKAVIYNFVENGRTYVRMESYIDDDVTNSIGNLVIDNNWKLASVVEDRGGWSTSNSDFDPRCTPLDKDSDEQYRQRDEIISLPGGTSSQNLAAWRSDDLTWNWKYLSVREVAVP